MAEEITDEQISQLEEKLKKLAELLTLRKIDWTHYSQREHTVKILKTLSKGDVKSYFTFSCSIGTTNQLMQPDVVTRFFINVTTNDNMGALIFDIMKDNTVACNYDFALVPTDIFDDMYLLEWLVSILNTVKNPDIEILFNNLAKEIEYQTELLSLISK